MAKRISKQQRAEVEHATPKERRELFIQECRSLRDIVKAWLSMSVSDGSLHFEGKNGAAEYIASVELLHGIVGYRVNGPRVVPDDHYTEDDYKIDAIAEELDRRVAQSSQDGDAVQA